MAGRHIDLNRQFHEVADGDDRPYRGLFGGYSGRLLWKDIHDKPRVVVLAEAGSGKSWEFERQKEILRSEDKFAFYSSVHAVAQSGFNGALLPADRQKFEEWKASAERQCWLFVDSVDEAKEQNDLFEDAARHLADAIAGREERANIIISSRFTDWDATADREAMEQWLSLPEPPPEPAPAFEDEVKATLQNRSKSEEKAEPSEKILVLRMAELDRDRVRQFAEASRISDVDRLLDAIEHGDLWRFAARPLDLAWIVEFWRTHGRLGTLREMIEESLNARLIDPDPKRRRKDPLNRDRSRLALNRIGAGFLLCGKDSLRIPSAGIDLDPSDKSIAIEKLLPDWPDSERLILLGRPVFDPATLGRARLHNDNEATLRCYLAARWLSQLLDNACPPQAINDLLFADIYGYNLVRPDMLDTTAWLAGFNSVVADELIARSPLTLISRGDPGSLPLSTRVKAFTATLDQIASIDKDKLWFIERSLRRFADSALDAHVAGWWAQAGKDTEAQHLILRLARLGKLPAGLEIARTAALDPSADEITQLLGCRLIIEMGSVEDKARLAQHVIESAASLSRAIVLEAMSGLVPDPISIDAFFKLIDVVGVADESGHKSIRPFDSEILAAISSSSDLQCFMDNVVARSGNLRGSGEAGSDIDFREAFAETAAEAAYKLLAFYPDEVPDAVTDLILLLHEAHRFTDAEVALGRLTSQLAATPGRRRSSYWRAMTLARSHPWNFGKEDVNNWSLNFLGWPVELGETDLDWLLADASGREEAIDRSNALSAAFRIWRDTGAHPEALSRIQAAVEHDVTLTRQIEQWLLPPTEDPEITRRTAELEAATTRNRKQSEERDNSWVELLSELKEDPSIFDRLNPQTEETVDSRLFHLWQFLSWRRQNRTQYSFKSLDAVEPIFGPELTRKFGEALVAFAHQYTATDREAADGAEPRKVSNFDLMALGGLSLAAKVTDWARNLDPVRAKEAARIAALELNGFPPYLLDLSHAQPDVVRRMLSIKAIAQLDANNPAAHGILDRLEYADPSFSALIAENLTEYLEGHPDLSPAMLEKLVSVLARALPKEQSSLRSLVVERANAANDPEAIAHYLLLAFAINNEEAVGVLRQRMNSLDPKNQAALCCALLPRVVGGRFNRASPVTQEFSISQLIEMLLLAYEGVRPDEDIDRSGGGTYSPEPRDEAQDARNAIFNRILSTSGEATHAAIIRLKSIPNFPVDPNVLDIHALRRAEADAGLAPWLPGDLLNFEHTYDRAPTTAAELQFLARRRLESIAHDLINGKFAQGDTLQALADEDAVQRWIAVQFHERRKESYTVQRETEFAESKAPDILLTSRHSGVDLPIEIKVVDGMSVAQLEEALELQLCAQYLRHEETRHGILLLIYQKERAGGWSLVAGEPLVAFDRVLGHLQSKARGIREVSARGAQPIIVPLDVSRVVPLSAKRARTRQKTAAKRASD